MPDHLFIFQFISDDTDKIVLGKNFNEIKITIAWDEKIMINHETLRILALIMFNIILNSS